MPCSKPNSLRSYSTGCWPFSSGPVLAGPFDRFRVCLAGPPAKVDLQRRHQTVHCRCLQKKHDRLSAKLHYTDTGYGHVVQHHQRTSSQQFCSLLQQILTTNGQKFATSQHLDMSKCWALALRCGKFLSVGGVVQHVRSRCPCSGIWH